MRILILNWRSIRDPLAGGAEQATFENARRWARNHEADVVWLSPKYDKCIEAEVVEGVHFRYLGPTFPRNIFGLFFYVPLFYVLVTWTYLREYRGYVDSVIDEVHGIPYLTPLYVKEKVFVYIHEVAGEIWDKMYPFPISLAGRIVERFVFKIYRQTKFIGGETVARELIELGIHKKNISVIKYGVNAPHITKVPRKNKHLTLIFLNRLVKMKGPERAIELFKGVHDKNPRSKMLIVGRGEDSYIHTLKRKVTDLGLSGAIKFLGFVSEKKKFSLLRGAHVLLNTSYKEGWGLVNIEANRMGTPVVTFRVKGNTESVKDGVSGYIFDESETGIMIDAIVKLEDNRVIRKSSLKYSYLFDWEESSEKFYEIINK